MFTSVNKNSSTNYVQGYKKALTQKPGSDHVKVHKEIYM